MRFMKLLSRCEICPRECGVNRLEGQKGSCGVGAKPLVSSAFLHFGEERCLVGYGGSGTIFFSGCNLKCVYCQNYEISQLRMGEEIEVEDLARIMSSLVLKGAENINFVTPTHQLPFILEALEIIGKPHIPLVYNCGGYEKVETLRLLEGVIDIYMPDFKYGDDELALKYSGVTGYTSIALKALEEMVRQQGTPVFERRMLKKGVLVRHLVLPNNLDSSFKVLQLLEPFKDYILLNVMDQYHPEYRAGNYPEINRRLKMDEYAAVLSKAHDMGFRVIN